MDVCVVEERNQRPALHWSAAWAPAAICLRKNRNVIFVPLWPRCRHTHGSDPEAFVFMHRVLSPSPFEAPFRLGYGP
jgi:hypothetical protein